MSKTIVLAVDVARHLPACASVLIVPRQADAAGAPVAADATAATS